MKILGVFFGSVSVELDNWQSKINKLEKLLNLWKSRSLSCVGKSLIINILGLSNKCAEVRCLNCENTGHRINDCKQLELCKICHDEAHTTANCQYFL